MTKAADTPDATMRAQGKCSARFYEPVLGNLVAVVRRQESELEMPVLHDDVREHYCDGEAGHHGPHVWNPVGGLISMAETLPDGWLPHPRLLPQLDLWIAQGRPRRGPL